MSDIAASAPQTAVGQGSISGLARFLSSRWLGLGFAAVAVASQSLGHQNGDNSWLLTVAEKTIDGARPYVDVIESNPPAAFLFYAPAILFARAVQVGVEFAGSLFVFLWCAASLALAGLILRRARVVSPAESGFLLNAAIFAFVMLPGFSFAEREHVACLLVLPMLAALAARALDGKVATVLAILAGLAAGGAMAIKPHFALAVALPALYLIARRRSLAPAFAPEMLAALAAAVANVGAIALCFPDYFVIAPATFDVYVPLREPWSYLLLETWFLLNIILLAALPFAFRRASLGPHVAIPALASAGFVIAYLIQGKGWVNHGLPGDELAFMAVAMGLAPTFATASEAVQFAAWGKARRAVLFVFMPLMLSAPILFGVFLPLTGFEEYKGLTAAVARHAPPHPRVIALSPRLDVGHPLTRRLGGEWVGRPNAIWLMVFSRMYLDAGWGDAAKRARYEEYIARDARGFREDVAAGRPDIVLVLDDPRIETAMRHPDIAAAMAGYAPVESADGVAIWTRK